MRTTFWWVGWVDSHSTTVESFTSPEKATQVNSMKKDVLR